MSGGVEWNCGIFGHHVHTCDTLFTAITKLQDGTPVLRMYEYESMSMQFNPTNTTRH